MLVGREEELDHGVALELGGGGYEVDEAAHGLLLYGLAGEGHDFEDCVEVPAAAGGLFVDD